MAILERPAPNETAQGVLTVRGIAYDTGVPVSRVDVYIDGVQRLVLGPTVARTDFCAQQNVRGCPLVGFQANLDVAALGLAPGTHNVWIRVTNIRGGFTDAPEEPVTFTIEPGPGPQPKGAVEAPVAGDTVSGTVQFRGYAYFDALPLRRVDVLIDGVSYPGVTLNVPRADVCDPLPPPKPPACPNVGWTLSLNTRSGTPPLPDGPHTLRVRVQDDSGRFTYLPEAPVPFTVSNGPLAAPEGSVTSPVANARLSGVVTVSGYAFSPGGRLVSVGLLVDGLIAATARYGEPRPEECAALPNITACPNIGFSATLDTRNYPDGPHVLGVIIRNDQGLSAIIPRQAANGMNVFFANR